MGDLVEGDDGMLVEEVGEWAVEKQKHLCRYIDIARTTRAKYIPPQNNGGATYIDLFCGPGRSKIRGTDTFIDGSAVAAWKKSRDGGAAFTQVIVADINEQRLELCVKRLEAQGAPVRAFLGPANETAFKARQYALPHALKLAFLDPYNLETLDFRIIQQLSNLKRIDVMVHVSKMDLQRNLAVNLAAEQSAFDVFAPGWRDAIDTAQQQMKIRADVFEFWRQKVAETGIAASENTKLIKGSHGQHLYWLLLAASHKLAHKFWTTASETDQLTLI